MDATDSRRTATDTDLEPTPSLARALLVPLVIIGVAAVSAGTAAGALLSTAVAISTAGLVAVLFAAAAGLCVRRATQRLREASEAAELLMVGRYSQRLEVVGGGWTREAAAVAHLHTRARMQLHEIDSRDRRFLMSISHELRTPLTAISGHAQALQEGVALDDESRERSLRVIMHETGRLERLVGDIIDLARLRSNRFSTSVEEVALQALGEHLLAIFADRAEDGPRVEGSFGEVRILSDGERILQILRNLVGNALRYAESFVRVTGDREQAHVLISVENDGKQIDPDIRDRMFEPFVGTKREGGMGLGLAISRELALALGGDLRLCPHPDLTRFELVLPLEPPGSGR